MQFLEKTSNQPTSVEDVLHKAVIKVVPVPTAMSKPLKINRILEEKIEALRGEVADIMASGMSTTSRMKM